MNGDERSRDHSHARRDEVDFKLTARRNKLLGLWAADLMGLSGEPAEAYAKDVVLADLDEPGDGDVIRKVMGDLDAKGVSASEDLIRAKLAACMIEARR